MVFEFGQQIESLKAVNVQSFKKIVVGTKFLARNFEVSSGKVQYFV
jgi:hypothetical protein